MEHLAPRPVVASLIDARRSTSDLSVPSRRPFRTLIAAHTKVRKEAPPASATIFA